MTAIELTRMSQNGQVVLPKALREKLGIGEHDFIQIQEVDGVLVIKKLELEQLGKYVGGGKK